jgi:Iron-sulfur cluster assembly accessory protein
MIHLTENAATHISNYIKNRGKGEGIRVGVKTSGCSGLAYVLEFVDDIDTHDQVFDQFGVKVFVDPKSLVYLEGMEMDYVKNGLNEGLNLITQIKKANVAAANRLRFKPFPRSFFALKQCKIHCFNCI